MEIVVDASVTLSWCFPDEQTPLSLKVLDRLNAGDAALVSAFWSVEVLNSLLVGEKRGRISPEQTLAFLGDLGALRPSFDNASVEQVFGPVQKLCREHNLTHTTPFTSNWHCARNVLLPLWTNRKETQRRL
jgi:predicted nucleic acid-binding protein